MEQFMGKRCECCGKDFDGEEQTVYCPACGAPAHRSCWDEGGGCPFKDRHQEGFVWKPSEQDTDQNRGDSEYRQESEELKRQREDFEREYGEKKYLGVSEREIMCFMNVKGPQSFYRLALVKHMIVSGKKLSFNFFAGFLNPYNQFYKGMLPLGFLLAALNLVTSLPQILVYYAAFFHPEQLEELAANASLLPTATFLGYLQFTVTVLLCLFGDYLYIHHMVRKIKKIRLRFEDETSQDYLAALVDAGKARPGLVAVCFGIQFVMILAVMTILAAAGF